jgi:hypothetical protein
MSHIHRLWKLIERIQEEEIFPSQWEEGLICPIYKKGYRKMCENCRGISLLNMAYKVFSVKLFQRLQPTVCMLGVGHKTGPCTARQVLEIISVGLSLKVHFRPFAFSQTITGEDERIWS